MTHSQTALYDPMARNMLNNTVLARAMPALLSEVVGKVSSNLVPILRYLEVAAIGILQQLQILGLAHRRHSVGNTPLQYVDVQITRYWCDDAHDSSLVIDMAQKRETAFGEFGDWLRQRRLATENRIPFLIRWVQRFHRLSASRPNEAWHDTLRVFLEYLGQGETPDWQIRQAADAVNLYFGQF